MSPIGAKARIFVSHSAKEREAQAVQDALVTELKKPERAGRFGLLLDKVTLKPGDMWRSRINLWVGGCDAAVILLSKAALESAYVAYEASILSYRAAMRDSLLLLPVLLEDVSEEDLKKGRLSPAQLAELQAVQGKGKSAKVIAQEVVARLEKEVLAPAETPIERRARQLAGELDVFDRAHLNEAASYLLKCQIDCWIPDTDEKFRLRLAIQLLGVGMNGAIDAVLSLREHFPSTLTKPQKVSWMQRVIQHVASSWVDTRSVERLPLIAKGEAAVAAVGLNAYHPVSMMMYVHCARCQEQFPETWYYASCDGIIGEDRIEQVVARLIEKLERVLAGCLDCRPEEVRKELVRMNSKRRQPIVVALPGEGMSDEILYGLHRDLPYVTFFLLLGDLNVAGLGLSEQMIEILFPELASEDESRFLQDYEDFKATVRVR